MDRIESSEIDSQNIVSWSLTKEQMQFNTERIVFLTNGTWTIGHVPAKKKKKKESRCKLYIFHKY